MGSARLLKRDGRTSQTLEAGAYSLAFTTEGGEDQGDGGSDATVVPRTEYPEDREQAKAPGGGKPRSAQETGSALWMNSWQQHGLHVC